MNLNDVRKLLDAKICVGEEYLGRQVETCCGSDLMSDVLAFTKCDFGKRETARRRYAERSCPKQTPDYVDRIYIV